MDLHAVARKAFEELNTALCLEGDAARVRCFWIEPDFDFEDEWMIFVIWELPAQGDEGWPLELLDTYRRRIRETIGDAALDHCFFRTPEEFADPAHQRGIQLQPA